MRKHEQWLCVGSRGGIAFGGTFKNALYLFKIAYPKQEAIRLFTVKSRGIRK